MNQVLSRLLLVALALGIGTVLFAGNGAATDWALGRMPFQEGFIGARDVAVGRVGAISAPMLVLALLGNRSRLLWGTAVLLAAAFEAFAVYAIWRASLTGFEGGADIGLGLIMMGSPLLILPAIGLVALFSGRPLVATKATNPDRL